MKLIHFIRFFIDILLILAGMSSFMKWFDIGWLLAFVIGGVIAMIPIIGIPLSALIAIYGLVAIWGWTLTSAIITVGLISVVEFYFKRFHR